MINKILNYWFALGLKYRKMRVLYEVNSDIEFFETCKREALDCDEDEIRSALMEESKKPDEEQDVKRIRILARLVSESKSVKSDYEKLKVMREELPAYIKTIR